MVLHTCKICNKSFSRKSDFIYHTQNKKTPCKPIDITKQMYTHNLPMVAEELLKNSKKLPKVAEKTQEKVNKLDNQEKLNTKGGTCPLCGVNFVCKKSISRHIKNNCLAKKIDNINNNLEVENDDGVNKIMEGLGFDEKTKFFFNLMMTQQKKLIKEIDELKKNITNTNNITNSHNTNNMTNSHNTNMINSHNTNNTQINIIAHGTNELKNIELEEVIKHLSTTEFLSIIPNFAKHIYINDSKPQNKNFFITDISRDSCKLHNGKKWVRGKASDRVMKILENLQVLLTDPFEKENIKKTLEFIENNKKRYNTKFITWAVNYLNNLDNEDDKDNIENKRKILAELKLIFYNNKEEILKIK